MRAKLNVWLCALVFLMTSCKGQKDLCTEVDVCVYGGTSAGVIAAYTAKQSGKSVLLIEPGRYLGGMTSGGLGYTDIGNKYVVRGLALDFYRRVGQHYGTFEQWIFEPKVASAVFNEYIDRGKVDVWFENRIVDADTRDGVIHEIVLENSASPESSVLRRVRAKVFIDCSYEGDLMARAGVSYIVGRESNEQYGETYNGVEMRDLHQFPDGVDPYVIEGDSTSGLVYGINPEPIQPNGSGDKKVQAYNFRITLTDRPENMIPITRPDCYDSSRYELLLRLKKIKPWKSMYDIFIWSKMPNGKTDINNYGGFSTDAIGENWNYPEASYEERARIWKFHEDYTKGLLYFVGHDPRVPEFVRKEMLQWGYPKDEYTDNGHWTHQLYIREARRMIGDVVMTQHHCVGDEIVEDEIGWAAYTMDSHNCDRHVVNGMVKNEGDVQIGGFPPYPISYRSIVPKRSEVTNLLVPVCLSASHIAYGSIRMEPVFMSLAQSAAVAACQAIDQHDGCVQDVDAAAVRRHIAADPLGDGSPADIFIDNNDSTAVKISGHWTSDANVWRAYGVDYLWNDAKSADQAVVYTPDIRTAGEYDLYIYFPIVENRSTQSLIQVFDGEQEHENFLKTSDVVVEGQTGGKWVHIGRYRFPQGRKGYVTLSGDRADGIVVADAILFVPVRDK